MKYFAVLVIALVATPPVAAIWPFRDTPLETPPDTTVDAQSIRVNKAKLTPVRFDLGLWNGGSVVEEAGRHVDSLDGCERQALSILGSSCRDAGEDSMNRFALALYNCQAQRDNKNVFPCSPSDSMSTCTSPMDRVDYLAYLVVANKARSICFFIQHDAFRAETETSVAALQTATSDQIMSLLQLQRSTDSVLHQSHRVGAQLTNVSRAQTLLFDNQAQLASVHEQHIDRVLNSTLDLENHARHVQSDLMAASKTLHTINATLSLLIGFAQLVDHRLDDLVVINNGVVSTSLKIAVFVSLFQHAVIFVLLTMVFSLLDLRPTRAGRWLALLVLLCHCLAVELQFVRAPLGSQSLTLLGALSFALPSLRRVSPSQRVGLSTHVDDLHTQASPPSYVDLYPSKSSAVQSYHSQRPSPSTRMVSLAERPHAPPRHPRTARAVPQSNTRILAVRPATHNGTTPSIRVLSAPARLSIAVK